MNFNHTDFWKKKKSTAKEQRVMLFPSHLKVSKFKNEFMKSSFLPKYEPSIVRISALYRAALQKSFILG